MSAEHPADAASDEPDLSIDIVRGAPSPEEVAALIAVVSEEYAAEASRAVAEEPVRSRWEFTARGLRTPLDRGRGWSGFTG